jgi:hypothetical protein
MASDQLRSWAERVIGATPAESPVKQIQLTTEAQVWQTWDGPFDVEKFVNEAETMLAQLAEELPTRRVTCTFMAAGADGQVRGTHLASVIGKNKQAGELSMGATGQASKSFAEAMETMVRVVNVVLKSAETQVSSLTRTVESQSTQLHEMHEYNRIKAELELVQSQDTKPDAMAGVVAQLQEAAPVLVEAWKLSVSERAEALARRAAEASALIKSPTPPPPNNGAH